jgi:antitoxin ParD1/3/4
MNISLPDPLKEFVEDQVSSGRYSSVSEYVRELIRGDEKRRGQAKLEALLLEGIQSGEPAEMTNEDWADIRREAVARIEARKKQNGQGQETRGRQARPHRDVRLVRRKRQPGGSRSLSSGRKRVP